MSRSTTDTRRRFLKTTGIVLSSSVVLAGCSSDSGSDSSNTGADSGGSSNRKESSKDTPTVTESGPGPGTSYADGALEQVTEFTVKSTDIGQALVGEVRNVSDDVLSYVQIEVQFLNGDRQVATALDNTNSLSSGVVWPFEAAPMEMEMPEYNYIQWRFTTS